MAGSSARRKGVLAATIVVVVLLLALTPPLVNVNRFQRRIASSMSASLGRPVHLDRVSLHLLPIPGFTLENLVVSEDPAFGNEPVIRANVVEARLRPGSLWRRQVEFSTLRFEEPSLNLVRNAQGRWNLQSLLTHAAAVESAPTAQQKAGPAPRFPYIEATGARVNVKMGDEKLPFSLTDADFALWLPSPERWRLRLEGKPARTDTSISDPGTISLEGSLDRPQGNGGDISRVPVDLHATWHKAPLGEASKVITGTDQSWRGNLSVEAALSGKLDHATLTSTVHVEDMHRADFYPAHTLDLQLQCSALAVVVEGVLHNVHCEVPVEGAPALALSAASLNLTSPLGDHADVAASHVPLTWLIDWLRLWSPRVPVKAVSGEANGMLALENHVDGWTVDGNVDMSVPGLSPVPSNVSSSVPSNVPSSVPTKTAATPPVLHWTVLPATGAVMSPATLSATDGSMAAVQASLTRHGYQFTVDGVTTAQATAAVLAYLPPLGDGMIAGPALKSGPLQPVRVDLTCARLWEQEQSCHAAEPVAVPRPRRKKR